MKKLYTALLLLFTGSASLDAQTYYPLLDSVNEWSYTAQAIALSPSNLLPPNCAYPYINYIPFKQRTTGDTTIGSYSYKILVNLDVPCTMGYLREDTAAQKVYVIDNQFNPEKLLYDFSMQPGDSLPLTFILSSGYSSGIYRLDSIRNFPIAAGMRRAFYLANHTAPGSPVLTWVESVGSLSDVMYPYFNNLLSMGAYDNCPGDYHDFEQFLICFSHDNIIYFDSCSQAIAMANPSTFDYIDSCTYNGILGGTVGENTALFTATFFPNPASDRTTLSLELADAETMTLFVYDITGKQLFLRRSLGTLPPGKSQAEIDLSVLPEGFYLAEVRSPKGALYSKVIVQR